MIFKFHNRECKPERLLQEFATLWRNSCNKKVQNQAQNDWKRTQFEEAVFVLSVQAIAQHYKVLW